MRARTEIVKWLRAVRKFREALQTLRSDLVRKIWIYVLTTRAFLPALMYLCASFNRFSRAHGSDLAPCDVAVGRPTQKGPFTLFGAAVLAELPQ